MQPEDIVVVGAGPAGLAASACLRREGLPHVVLEREQCIASAWRLHYDRLHLHTTKTYSGLPMTPWPKSAPRYPSRAQMVQYLQAYAAQHQITPRLGVNVHAVRRTGDRFAVDTSAGSLTPRIVVMATGYNGVPKIPTVPGLVGFRGSAIHASAYKNPAPYLGKRTLVVGCGNSGAEIAPDGVRFAGGAVHPFEAIIFATGYTPGLGTLIEGFDTIADARGRPHRFGEETGIPGLYFVGFKNPPTGALREIALEAPRMARSMRASVAGPAAARP